MSIFTIQGSDGRNIQSVQPVPSSVVGSPFTIDSTTPQITQELTGLLVVVSTEDMHLKFSKSRQAILADSNDMFIPCRQWFVFPMDGDVMSMVAVADTGVLYAQLALGI